MRSRRPAFHDADESFPAHPAPHIWHHTGDGVVFFDTAQRRRERDVQANSRRWRWAAIAAVLAVFVLGMTAAVALDWFAPDALITLKAVV